MLLFYSFRSICEKEMNFESIWINIFAFHALIIRKFIQAEVLTLVKKVWKIKQIILIYLLSMVLVYFVLFEGILQFRVTTLENQYKHPTHLFGTSSIEQR